MAKFLVPDIIFGVGVLSEVGQAARRQGGVHVFVVSDPGVVRAGWTSEVLRHLEAVGVTHELWVGVTPNPKDREVEAGCRAYLASKCDVLVAVGGGSCIDAAKAIAVLATHGGPIAEPDARLSGCRGARVGARHRREHRGFHGCKRRSAETAAVPASRSTGRRTRTGAAWHRRHAALRGGGPAPFPIRAGAPT